MPIFRRRDAPPQVQGRGYGRFRQAVREDFSRCCAYCLLPEFWAGGARSFQLDHHRPKSIPRFSHLRDDFFNLFYCCYACNKAKSNRWPSSDGEAAGFRFLDFTADTFDDHFEIDSAHRWLPLTPAAVYTERWLLLNDTHMVAVRLFMASRLKRLSLPPIDWNRPLSEQLPV